jgi:lysine 2,3-aminomutase
MACFDFIDIKPKDGVPDSDWNNWAWQLRHSLKSKSDFAKAFALSADEEKIFDLQEQVFNIRATPYSVAVCQSSKTRALRRILMPHRHELSTGQGLQLDPLAEKVNSVATRLIHRYSDRVLFLITDICSVYCRFCTRKHFTGQEQAFLKDKEFVEAINYIKANTGIREVILSGGDPLTVSDQQLAKVLKALREINHIEIIRIGTRMPVVAPQRITAELAAILRSYAPVFVMTHFNHPKEITLQSAQACELLVDKGIPVFNQMVLLNGVNNHAAIVQALSRRLLYLRVKPYYMFQCDPSFGTDHLRTSIDESLEIQRELWGHFSGLAMPNYAVDIPSGGGKSVLTPNFEQRCDLKKRSYKGWDGVEADYVNPPQHLKQLPEDIEDYLPEWNRLKTALKHD